MGLLELFGLNKGPYNQGYDAFKEGKDEIIDNPYPFPSHEYMHWNRGYVDAEYDASLDVQSFINIANESSKDVNNGFV